MQFYSTKDKDHRVSFQQALLSSLAPDGGLYMPEIIPTLSLEERENLSSASLAEVAFVVARKFVEDEIPEVELKKICDEAYDFEVPILSLDAKKNQYVLELIHGPTFAFKDFAARFMARCVSYFLQKSGETRTILVATSGDTGGAIGNSFLGLKGIKVNILYPKGGVSKVQEQQLTTMGQNVRAFEIDGSFDDCQRLVKEAFADKNFNAEQDLMSANSINVGRILPQSFYYVWSSLNLAYKNNEKLVSFAIPSGNLGNSTGALVAKLMGAPIEKIIVGHNANHPFIDFLKTGDFFPVPSVATISNAMDIGHPNNYYRIAHLLPEFDQLTEFFWGVDFSDEETSEAILELSEQYDYIACPHTAVGYLTMKGYESQFPHHDSVLVVAATAHPGKFQETVEASLGQKIEIPKALQSVLEKPKVATLIKPTLESLKQQF